MISFGLLVFVLLCCAIGWILRGLYEEWGEDD